MRGLHCFTFVLSDLGINNSIVAVDVDAVENEIVCNPNPAINIVNLTAANENKEVVVMAMLWREVFCTQVKNKKMCNVNVNDFSAGAYVIRPLIKIGTRIRCVC